MSDTVRTPLLYLTDGKHYEYTQEALEKTFDAFAKAVNGLDERLALVASDLDNLDSFVDHLDKDHLLPLHKAVKSLSNAKPKVPSARATTIVFAVGASLYIGYRVGREMRKPVPVANNSNKN